MNTFGFIGCGNMGGALARAAGTAKAEKKLLLCDHHAERTALLAKECGAEVCDLETVAKESDFLFLGVKPQVLGKLCEQLAPLFACRTSPVVLITMAAGVSMEGLKAMTGEPAVIRIMPNTPVAVGAGTVLYCKSESVSEEQLNSVLSLLAGAGHLVPIDEAKIDAAACVSGCGPAFVCLFAEALADGAVKCGLPRATALALAAQTLEGTAKLLQESGKHPGQLKDEVCSPGGTTIAGVLAMEDGAFRASAAAAVIAAYEKTMQMKK